MSTLCARNGRASTRLTVAVRQALFGSTLALLATSTALSQEQETLEAVVVTGTRIKRDGYSAPTPTTIVTQEDIAAAAPGTVADGLNQLPQFQGSSTPQAGGVSANGAAGSNFLSLRNLEPHRSLILLDGRRFVAATDSGATDINTLPQNLIERVDVVTGGASAAYGSDAVAGVVNFVLDTDFVGWKGNVQGGMSTYGDSESVKASIAHGRPLAGGRGHLLFSAEYYKSEGIGPYDDNRKWNTRGSGRINNTTGVGPRTLVVKDGATVSAATFGGLITAGPLAGTQFLPGGIPAPFEFGEYRSSTAFATTATSLRVSSAGMYSFVPTTTSRTTSTCSSRARMPMRTRPGSSITTTATHPVRRRSSSTTPSSPLRRVRR
jgi:iron complex outermembrane receptor protein